MHDYRNDVSAKAALDAIANQAGIDVRAGGWNRNDEFVARYTYAGTCLRVVFGGHTGSQIVHAKVLEFGVNGGDRTGWGVNGYNAPTWLSRPPTHYEGMSAARGQQIDGWYEAMHDARSFATLGWAIAQLMELVSAKSRDEARRAS